MLWENIVMKLMGWLKDENNRGALGVITGGVAVVVAAAWTAYVYFFPPFPAALTELETTFLICKGDNPNRCPSNARWVDCGLDYQGLSRIGAKLCTNLGVELEKNLYEMRGGVCGHSLYEIKCAVSR
jgi:hypothetical protein